MTYSGFARTENQILLEQSLGRYLRDSYTMPERARIIETAVGVDADHWAFFSDLGLLGLPFAESDGGFDGSLWDVMLIAKLFGEALVVEPYCESVVLAGRLLAMSQSAEQRRRWLPGLIAGEQLVGFAHLEKSVRKGGDVRETVLSGSGDTLTLSGAKYLVAGAPAQDVALVTARNEGGHLVVCVVSLSASGVSVRPYTGIDGRRYGDITFDKVVVTAADVLALDNAESALSSVIACGEAYLCAEAVGIMESLHRVTVEYSQIRKQFGVAIGSFQALKHRMVDGYTTLYQLQNLVELVAHKSSFGWKQHLAAAKMFVRKFGLQIGHDAIQIHGAMGVTDELVVSHYHKRLVVIRMLLGIDEFSENAIDDADDSFIGDKGVPAFEALLENNAQAFRKEVRQFVGDNLTKEIRDGVLRQVNAFTEPETTGAWLERLQSVGWQAPHWPVELGGTDWSPMQRFVYEYETGLEDVPELAPMGFKYVGPVIAQFGSDWQKSYFLPKILSGEHYWAQGFSEPQAGSDLAAIKTTAVRDGDDFVINGTKIWTTHAHHANWLFCIARTDLNARPQKGAGFFLIELNSPGIRIESIPLMTGPREVNQVFLDEVRVPATHLVGELTRGWDYTKFLLEFERGGSVFCGRARSELGQAKSLLIETRGSSGDILIRQRLAELEVRLMALELLEYRHAVAMEAGGTPGVGGSIAKLLASELRQDISELTVAIVGYSGVELNNELLCSGSRVDGGDALNAQLVAIPRYLNMRAASIYGGSSEVQKEIIAKEVLGLR